MPAAFPPPWCVANVVGCSLSARTGSMKRRQFIALIGGGSRMASPNTRAAAAITSDANWFPAAGIAVQWF